MLDGTILRDMIGWIDDCGADTVGRSESEIVDAVERNYEGGVEQFLADGGWYQITPDNWVWQGCHYAMTFRAASNSTW